jgi:HSP20 family protein
MMSHRWDRGSELRRMEESLNRLLRGFGSGPAGGEDVESWAVPLDVVAEGDNILVRASLPGVKPNDVKVTIEEDVLTIKGETREEHEEKGDDYLLRERRSGSFHRSLRLPDTVDAARASSTYEDGVLTISFPKQEAKKPKVIEVKAKKAS